jgi:hypothetical protein
MNTYTVKMMAALALVASGLFAKEPTPSADYYAKWATPMIILDTAAGKALLDTASPDYAPLREKRVDQLKSHCGAASAVAAMNSLLPAAGFTQDSIFNEQTAHIIAQATVYKVGFTLEELTAMVTESSGLKAVRFHTDEYGYEAWVAALKANRANGRDRIICNFATGWMRKRENTGGHFSPVADYNEATNQVLILEVSGGRPAFWIGARELWDAMNLVDKVSGRVRGWIVVTRP